MKQKSGSPSHATCNRWQRGHAQIIAELIVDRLPPKRVLDIAAGHGLYGIAVASLAPQALIVAQDWPKVLAVAEENARAAGLAERYQLLPGSAFEVEFGPGFDLVLIANFLHHFDEPTCVSFLRKVRAASIPAAVSPLWNSFPTKTASPRRAPRLLRSACCCKRPPGTLTPNPIFSAC